MCPALPSAHPQRTWEQPRLGRAVREQCRCPVGRLRRACGEESPLAGTVPGGRKGRLLGESACWWQRRGSLVCFSFSMLRPLVRVRASRPCPCPSSLPSPGASCRPRTCPEGSSPEGLVAKRQPSPESLQAPTRWHLGREAQPWPALPRSVPLLPLTLTAGEETGRSGIRAGPGAPSCILDFVPA